MNYYVNEKRFSLLISFLISSAFLLFWGISYSYSIDAIKIYGIIEEKTVDDKLYISVFHVVGKLTEKIRTNVCKRFTNTQIDNEYVFRNQNFTNEYKIFTSKNKDNIIVIYNGMTYKLQPLTELTSWQYDLKRISKVYHESIYPLIFINNATNKIVSNTKEGIVNFKEFETLNYNKLLIIILLYFILWMGIYIFIRHSIFESLLNVLTNNLIISIGVTTLLILFYIILFPGIYGMDCIAPYLRNGKIAFVYSAIYSLLLHLISVIDFNFIIIFHIIIFLVSIMMPISFSGKFCKIQQLFILLFLFILIACPATLIIIYGIQRITTTNILTILYISLMYSVYAYKQKTESCLNISLIILSVIILMRIENIAFLIPFVYILINNKIPLRNLKLGLTITFFIFIGSCTISTICKNENNFDRYVSLSLNTMMKPYVKDDSPVHIYFKSNMWSPTIASINKSDYNAALKYFCKKVIIDPAPYLQGCFARFIFSCTSPNTWNHSYNKYKLYKQEQSNHRNSAFKSF